MPIGKSVSVSVSVTAFGWFGRFSRTKLQNVNIYKSEPGGVEKTCEDHPHQCLDGLHRFFDTIQNLMLMHTLLPIHGVFLLTICSSETNDKLIFTSSYVSAHWSYTWRTSEVLDDSSRICSKRVDRLAMS